MAVKSKDEIVTTIQSELADNNAGLISAYDVRHNMLDIVESINQIVASGDFDTITPYTGSNVRAKIKNEQYGMFIPESGLFFPNRTDVNSGYQYEPYPGPFGINHNSLSDLTNGDPHTQYVNINGSHKMVGNFAMGEKWINSSGNVDLLSTTMNDRGLKFEYIDTSNELMHVGNKTTVEFDEDNSTIYSAKGVAQAWINFNGSGAMSINSSYNIDKLQKTADGKFKIFFKPGLFIDNSYVAMGHSNSRTAGGTETDFDLNTVGLVDRTSDYITFLVINDNGEYVNAAVNDLIIFGNHSGVTPDTTPTIEDIS